jgi:hypothetical protein
MEIVRHPGYLEIRLPEFFDLDPRIDNLARVFSAVQPGTHNLLLNLTGQLKQPRSRDDAEIVYFSRALEGALKSITVEVEMVAFLVTAKLQNEILQYARLVESAGFDVRVFTNKQRAIGWLGH